jgi:hypothetical protein
LKSLLLLWKKLADELASQVSVSATIDCKTIDRRCKHEGLSFITITLPTFGSDLQKGLDQGFVDRNLFQGFSWKGGLPKFLSGFLGLVFNRDSGVLLDQPDKYAIFCIRQLTLSFAKINLPCSDARTAGAFSDYIECEKEMRELDRSWRESDLIRFRRMAHLLFREAFTLMDKFVYDGDMLPKHGPGSTADGLRGNSKFKQRSWPSRLEEYFPSGKYLFPSWADYLEGEVHFLEPGSEIPVRVISVPKTQKTPRIIAMEPTAMQYAQQAVLERLLESLSGVNHLNEFLGFKDQTPNQRMALEGSITGSLATLDLSEASDRVSNQLVREMTHHFPHLREAFDATRSRKADVPGYGVLRLSKFASMGSALCFPVEAMVFLTVIFLGIESELRTPLTRKDIKSYIGKVRVYGDDIIIPQDTAHSVVSSLQTFGFVVNEGKSFWNGKFRESCGKEYYDGLDVSITKVRRLFPTHRQDAQEVISLVSLRNQLFELALFDTVTWLDEVITDILIDFPYVSPSSPVLGRFHYANSNKHSRTSTYDTPLVKGYIVDYQLPSNSIDGADALLKWFLKRGDNPFPDRKHLERSGRPQSVYLKLGWFADR